jgi:hypothetical protein
MRRCMRYVYEEYEWAEGIYVHFTDIFSVDNYMEEDPSDKQYEGQSFCKIYVHSLRVQKVKDNKM